MSDSEGDSFGALLNVFRKRAHLTQQQLAEAVGMHRHAISRWEQGDVLPASKAIVLELARLLHLNDQEARNLLDASLTAPVPFWDVPYPRNLFFTGREAILETLYAHLSIDQTTAVGSRVSAVQGLAGVGKTQVALEYAYRHALEYNAIFWIEAETVERVLFSLQHIAEVLQLPARTAIDQHEVVSAVQRWLATHHNWLLIWDNLEDLELPQRTLSPTLQGAFLLTTRRQVLGTLARGVEVRPMEREEGILLLLRRAKVLELEAEGEHVHQLAFSKPADSAAAADLVSILGGLPLALDQAGAYLEETGCSFTDYQHRYEQQRAFLLDRRGGPGSAHPQSVMTTFLLALERIEQEQTEVADLLRVCAFLHAEAIPEELFQADAASLGPELASLATDPVRFDQALGVLRNLSLVQRQAQTHTLSLHRLIQAVLREQMEPAEELLWSRRVVRMVNAAFPEGTFATWRQCERYLAQALACVPLVTLAGTDVPEAGELLAKAGYYLSERGRLEEAEPLLAQALALAEQHYGPDHPALIPRLRNQVELAWKQGKYAHAEAVSSRLLAIEERHLEPIHTQIGDTLTTLAVIYTEQSQYEQAEPLYQRALHIQEQALGPEHYEIATVLDNLAILYWRLGRYEQAEPLYLRALHIREQVLGPKHPDVATSLNNLAVFYRNQGRYEQAVPLFRQALHIREQTLGLEHPDVAFSLGGLAVLYRDQGQYEQAEPLVQRALQIQELALGPEHPDVALSLNNLATLSLKQGKDEQAEKLYKRALQICEQHLDPSHLEIARSLAGLGSLYSKKQSKTEQAEQMLQRAGAIFEQHLGPDHIETVQVRNALQAAGEQQDQGKAK